MIELIEHAERCAVLWHGEQKRKYTGCPYWWHPRDVAALVGSVTTSPSMIAAAWLHDVMEDCGVSYMRLVDEFNPWVAELVGWLTDVSHKSDGSREIRKAKDRDHLRRAPREAKTIKLADLMDNASSISAHDQPFATIYIPEKRLLLDESLKDGDPILWASADKLVRNIESCWLNDWFRSKGAA